MEGVWSVIGDVELRRWPWEISLDRLYERVWEIDAVAKEWKVWVLQHRKEQRRSGRSSCQGRRYLTKGTQA